MESLLSEVKFHGAHGCVQNVFDDFPAIALCEIIGASAVDCKSEERLFEHFAEAVEAEGMRVVGVLLLVGKGGHCMFVHCSAVVQ